MSYEDYTDEAAAAILLCKQWAAAVRAELPSRVYLFGSAIYLKGDRFDHELSDLDLVVCFDDAPDATARAARLEVLRRHKAVLELQMIRALHRRICDQPGVSIVPLYPIEVQANIHKGHSRNFFDRNIFLDLATDDLVLSLPSAGTISIADDDRYVLEKVQAVRNIFLSVAANGMGGLDVHDGHDPVPKDLARAAALLVRNPVAGGWYDTRFGLDLIHADLQHQRDTSTCLSTLAAKVSGRRDNRNRKPLTDADQLLIAELLFDRAATGTQEAVMSWEVRFGGVTVSQDELARLADALRRLLPDAHIIGIFEGSIIMRLRSSVRSFNTAKRLLESGALAAYFEVPEIAIAPVSDREGESGFAAHGLVDRIAAQIGSWRPDPNLGAVALEMDLADFIARRLEDVPQLAGTIVTREQDVGHVSEGFAGDILLRFPASAPEEYLMIELTRLRNRGQFVRIFDRLRSLNIPAIFVVLTNKVQWTVVRRGLGEMIDQDGQIRVVPLFVDPGGNSDP